MGWTPCAARVWGVLSNVQSWPAWLPTVERVEALDAWPLATGRRYRMTQPKLRPGVWKVAKLELGKRFTWRASSTGMAMIADHLLEATGSNTTRIQLRYDFIGWLGAPMGMIFGRRTRSYLGREARVLKHRAESK